MPQDRVSGCSFTRFSTHTLFLYYMPVKFNLMGYFWCFSYPCYALVVTSNRWKQYHCSSLHGSYILGVQVNFSVIAIICWMIQTIKYQCCGFQGHFKSTWVYDLKTKSDFDQMSTLYDELHNIFGLYIFFISIGSKFGIYQLFAVLNLECIHAVLSMLWPFQ